MICHNCQTPIASEDPPRTHKGEPVHEECKVPDITPADVEGVREAVLESIPADASDEARSVAIDAIVNFDRRLTDPEVIRDEDV